MFMLLYLATHLTNAFTCPVTCVKKAEDRTCSHLSYAEDILVNATL